MIRINNIYYMLSYAFSILKENGYAKLETEEFENIEDLLTAILAEGISNQIKRGLGKEYIQISDSLSRPVGKISISESIKQRSFSQKRLICDFDEFCEDTYINQILKSVSFLLIRSKTVSKERRNLLKKVMIYFDKVTGISPYGIKWSSVRYNKNNKTYQLLINICKLVIEGLILTTENGDKKLASYLDDARMSSLYEKFVLEYYKKHYPKLQPAAPYIKWDVDDGIIDFLPAMRTDIVLSLGDNYLIIDTKYYGRTMQKNYNKHTIHSNNIYQIFSYVKNKDAENTGKVRGMLLYAKTEEEITPNHDYSLGGNKFSVKTLDLNCDFEIISKQLDEIADNFINESR